MVKFNKKDKIDFFSFDVEGDKQDYIDTIEILLDAIMYRQEDEISSKDRYVLCNLIKALLPNRSQIISMEEVAELERFKARDIKEITE